MQIDCLHRIAYWHAKPETSTPEILRRFFTDSLENLWRIFGESSSRRSQERRAIQSADSGWNESEYVNEFDDGVT